MYTGIFIRAQVDGKWGSYDVGDPVVPDSEVVGWMESRYDGKDGHKFLMRLAMILLDRSQDAVQ